MNFIAAALLAALASSTPAAPAPAPRLAADTSTLSELPILELPAKPGGGTLAIFITGDGGWASIDKTIVKTLTDSGIAVVGVNSRDYLEHHSRTPDDASRDVARIARHYLAAWGRQRLLLVGYSRGADIMPFVLTRLPDDVRLHISGVALVGLGPVASFQFHFIDIFKQVRRPTDLPILPELSKLKGLPMMCVYGADEEHSACHDAPPSLLTRYKRPGNHHFDGDYQSIANLIVTTAKH